MKIKEIMGKGDSISFVMDNEAVIKGIGRQMPGEFLVEKKSLRISDNDSFRVLKEEELEEFAVSIKEFTYSGKFKISLF